MRTAAIFVLFAFLASGCATYHSPEFEKSAVAAHSSLNSFLIENKNKTGPVSYKNLVKQYNNIEGKMGDMVFASYLVDNNADTIQIAQNIRQDFSDMRKLHQEQGTASPSFFARKYQGYELLFLDLTKAEKSKPKQP